MFDVQFIMIIVSTILEGTYFNRNNAINKYIEKYNSTFEGYTDVLNGLLKAAHIIEKLKFSQNSYWFNKANLLILIVELSKINEANLDFQSLESDLLDLEKKVDIYFTDENITMISEEERKYFEYSRQGSNGLTEREFRGKIIKEVINRSIQAKVQEKNALVELNVAYLKSKQIDFATIKPTETGLTKKIIDATSNVREFLKEKGIHNYEEQGFGPDKKVIKEGKFIRENAPSEDTKISFYRSNGRGDCRIWFNDLNNFSKAQDELALIEKGGILHILNLTIFDYKTLPNYNALIL